MDVQVGGERERAAVTMTSAGPTLPAQHRRSRSWRQVCARSCSPLNAKDEQPDCLMASFWEGREHRHTHPCLQWSWGGGRGGGEGGSVHTMPVVLGAHVGSLQPLRWVGLPRLKRGAGESCRPLSLLAAAGEGGSGIPREVSPPSPPAWRSRGPLKSLPD